MAYNFTVHFDLRKLVLENTLFKGGYILKIKNLCKILFCLQMYFLNDRKINEENLVYIKS